MTTAPATWRRLLSGAMECALMSLFTALSAGVIWILGA